MLSVMLVPGSILAAGPPTAAAQVTYIVRTDVRTGRLVRAAATPARPGPKATPQIQIPDSSASASSSWQQVVHRIAQKHAVDSDLVDSVIRVESNYNPFAISVKGARGLMQLEPETAKRFGGGDGFSAAQNVDAGVRYLKYLLDTYHGDHHLALAAYNAGEGAVGRWGGVPPYAETQRYVYEVGKKFGDAKEARKNDQAVAAEAPAKTSEGYNPILSFMDATGRIFYRTP
jgi:soluble lytic murein transglycosylase-like protein